MTSRSKSKTMLIAEEEQKWNSAADNMQQFHDHFKLEFKHIYQLADGSFSNRGMSLQTYLRMANQLVRHLTAHHTIEEEYIFPVLAKRMPGFGTGERHLKSHEAIHDGIYLSLSGNLCANNCALLLTLWFQLLLLGLDKLSALIRRWTMNPSTYSPTEMMACLDSWREVLFKHLDEEVSI
ncbi:hypothetical protein AcV7_004395 [Taiwanofungus camphoratus]|nr:hypothetical protein AcV7_004395 [Antrodia cinnamomea]